jgi:hypothetical protein
MSNERMYPILPCADIDEAIEFYAALGFEKTYRQVRPNPHAVVARDDMHIHLGGIEGFDPELSYASVIIVVPDPDALYASFAAGLREKYGKLPVAGIPRLVRPRKRWGTVYGFSVVDVGGNWLRISRIGDQEAAPDATEPGMQRVIEVAARLADAHGDDAAGFRTLDSWLSKDHEASPIERARGLLYHAELAFRLGRPSVARDSLDAVGTLDLDAVERASLDEDVAHVTDLLATSEVRP